MSISFKEGHGIAEKVARKFVSTFPWMNFDDLYQEAWIGLLSVTKYSDDGQAAKKTYYYRAASNKVVDHICAFRKPVSGGHLRVMETIAKVKIEKPEALENVPDKTTPEDALVSKQETELVKREIKKLCGFDEVKAKWITLVLSGECRAREVADMLNMEITKVYEITKVIKSKIKNSKPLAQLRGIK